MRKCWELFIVTYLTLYLPVAGVLLSADHLVCCLLLYLDQDQPNFGPEMYTVKHV